LTNNNINISTFKVLWTILITIGVFAATLYTTQSVASTRMEFIQKEIVDIRDDYDSLLISIDGVKSDQKIALADISQKLHQMELQLKELQVTLFILIDESRNSSTRLDNTSDLPSS
jgi:hypothetical protein